MASEFIEGLETRIESLEEKMQQVVDTNKELKELLEFFKNARAGFNLIVGVFKFLRWVGIAALLIWGAWYAVKHGSAPPNPL